MSIIIQSAGAPGDQIGSARRRDERKKVSWAAMVRLPDGQELPCLVKDASRSGAKLSLPPAFPLAKTFLLKVEETGFAFSVTLRWRRGGYVGVSFDKVVRLRASTSLPEELR